MACSKTMATGNPAATQTATQAATPVVLVGSDNGVVVVAADTPLKRLNYFDGKFLRAVDMQAEQDYLRTLVQLSNRAGGSGVVNGYDTSLAPGGAAVTVGQGMALDPQGRVLLMPLAKTMSLDDLIAATAAAQQSLAASAVGSASFGDCTVVTASTATASGQSGDLYLLTVGFLEALCGEEDVFGQICDNACVQSKDRRWRVEGVVFRAVPLTLNTALEISQAVPVNANQLRSRVASAYFEDERQRIASLVNGTSIKSSPTWYQGALAEIGDAVPLAVFSRSGGATKFLDTWTARRERMEAPPRRYWAWRLAMRPWDVFLAQVLQFQCQLRDVLSGLADGGTGGDPCAPKIAAIGKAAQLLAQLETWHLSLSTAVAASNLRTLSVQPFQIAAFADVKRALADAAAPTGLTGTRILIDGGIVELPPAGYLPVAVGGPTVNEQVRNLMGPGVDLRFCICRPDYIPHVFEEAQHMERISLLDGIDDPKAMPRMDVFVPNGQAGKQLDRASLYFDAAYSLQVDESKAEGPAAPKAFRKVFFAEKPVSGVAAPAATSSPSLQGAARWAPFGDKGQQFYWAGALPTPSVQNANLEPARWWFEATVDRDPFALIGPSQFASIYARVIQMEPQSQQERVTLQIVNLRFTPSGPSAPGSQPGEIVIEGTVAGGLVSTERPPATGCGGSSISVAIRFRRLVTAVGGRITIEPLDQQKSSSFYYWQWTTGSALTGSLHLAIADATGKVTRDISIYSVKEDPDAQNPANPFHGLSELAIPALQNQLATEPFNDKGFAIYAEQALFPPADPKSSFDVIATLDWVLFARRRECSCNDEVFTPPVADKKFQVYWVDPDQIQIPNKDFIALLLSSDPKDVAVIKKLTAPIGSVSYPGTGASLRDLATALSDAKAALGERTILRGGRIGQQPPQDPTTLERARLQSYSTLLQGFMALDPQADFDSLSIMPPALADPNVSGAMLIAASKPPEREELVFRVSPQLVEQFARQLKQVLAGQAKLSSLVVATPNTPVALSQLVGVGRFKRNEAALQSDSDDLATQWAKLGDGDAAEADALMDPAEVDSAATVASRTASVGERLKVSPAAIPQPTILNAGVWDLDASMNPAFAKAKSALFLIASPGFLKVTLYEADPIEGRADPIAALKIGSLSVMAQDPTVYRPVGTFDFNAVTGQIANPVGLVAAWGANNGAPQFGRVFFQGAAGDAAVVVPRAQAVMEALKLGGTAGHTDAPELDNVPADAGSFEGAPMMMVIGFAIIG
jgi:hypothetical protein